MSSHDLDVVERLHAVAEGFEMPAARPSDDVRRGRRRARRDRGMLAGAVAVALVLGATAALGSLDRGTQDVLDPAEGSGPGVVGVPVWYDANGLHHGDTVVQTPVDILQPERPLGPDSVVPAEGALALVRSGALYLHPPTGDVWFHPWGGEPRVVGRNSVAGPGGDPNGDTAAWFDGSELVVFDTAARREISRTVEVSGPAVGSGIGGDHYPAGNGFLQVSAERIVWTDTTQAYSHDFQTGSTSVVEVAEARYLIDVHGEVEVLGERDPWLPVVKVPDRAEQRFPQLETHVRLSPSGNYVLAPESADTRHGAAILHTRTGELWQVPRSGYPWIAWSYGDVALVDTEDALLACAAPRRSCEELDAQRPFLLPTN